MGYCETDADYYDGSIGIVTLSEATVESLFDLSGNLGIFYVVVPLLKSQNLTGNQQSFKSGQYLLNTDVRLHEAGSKYNVGVVVDSFPSQKRTETSSISDDRTNLDLQISYALYMGIGTIYVTLPKVNSDLMLTFCAEIARLLCEYITCNPDLKIGIILKMNNEEFNDGYENWNYMRNLCNYNSNLYIGVIIDEPVMDVWIDTSLLLPQNENDIYDTEPITIDQFSIIFKKCKRINIKSSNFNIDEYRNAIGTIKQLFSKYNLRKSTSINSPDLNISDYDDVLQQPLQVFKRPALPYSIDITPFFFLELIFDCSILTSKNKPLTENLGYCTYQVFERDIKKYDIYNQAITAALHDMVKIRGDGKTIVLMVLGAGKGPFVTIALNSSKRSSIPVRIYAVEKNRNAVTTLMHMNNTNWAGNVIIACDDMRFWQYPEKADIVVSELLGSFGDNELSPECLDGGLRCLKDDGISIPSSYTSFVCPISCAKIYHTLSTNQVKENPFEMPYVVKLESFKLLSKPLEVWSFHHRPPFKSQELSSRLSNEHNKRSSQLIFDISENATAHGLVGYFSSVLYKDIFISIVPGSSTDGMYSWFPMYFPLKKTIAFKKNDKAILDMWRLVNEVWVWYEWCLTKYEEEHTFDPIGAVRTLVSTGIHNSGSKRFKWKLYSDVND